MAPKTEFVIIGDSYTDYFCFVAGGRLPSAGEDAILQDPIRRYPGGSPINTATHLQALLRVLADDDDADHPGVVVTVQTVLNETDADGQLLLQHAAQKGFRFVNCLPRDGDDGCSNSGVTPHCVVMVTGDDRTFLTHSGCASSWTAADVCLSSSTPQYHQHVHVAGYYSTPGFLQNKSLFRAIQQWKADAAARNTNLTISLVTQFDVTGEWDGGLVTELIPLLDILIMNEQEANSVLQAQQKRSVVAAATEPDGCPDDESVLIQAWASFFSHPDVLFVITMGARGAVVIQNQSVVARYCCASPSLSVVDTTGAGDAFASGFLHGFFCDGTTTQNVRRALAWGCCVGSASVSVRGASTDIPTGLVLELLSQGSTLDIR